MAECVCVAGCIFFNDKMANMPSMADIYKERYCKGDSTQCARYVVFKALGRENVPGDLYPNDLDRAEKLLVEVA
jgi:hypothetical protein